MEEEGPLSNSFMKLIYPDTKTKQRQYKKKYKQAPLMNTDVKILKLLTNRTLTWV